MKSLQAVLLAFILSVTTLGCTDRNAAPGPSPSNSPSGDTHASDLQLVQQVFAEQLQIDAQAVRPEATLAQLGADDLDLVEAVLEIEDRLGITIPDKLIDLPSQSLTIQRFAEVVGTARTSP